MGETIRSLPISIDRSPGFHIRGLRLSAPFLRHAILAKPALDRRAREPQPRRGGASPCARVDPASWKCRHFHTLYLDVRLRSQQLILQASLETRVNGESNDQRRNTSGHPDDRDDGDHADDGLAPLGTQVTSGNEKFKSHARSKREERRTRLPRARTCEQ